MRKLVLLMLPLMLSVVSATCETPECFCPNADIIIPVNLWVVGENCYKENHTQDSTIIEIQETADYEVYGIIERGNPGQNQTNEAFYLVINGKNGPVSLDDPEPDAITTKREFLLYQYLTQGFHEVIMHSVAKCPPDTTPNSVRINHLCLYKDVSEFVCSSDNDCDDGNSSTLDLCIFPNTVESYCKNTETVLNILSPEAKKYRQREIKVLIESNAPKVLYSIDGAPPEEYSHIFYTLLNHGEHIIKAFAHDYKNNLLKESTTRFNVELNTRKSVDDTKKWTNCKLFYESYYYFNEPYDEYLCPDYELYFPPKNAETSVGTYYQLNAFDVLNETKQDENFYANPPITKESSVFKSLILTANLFLTLILLLLLLASLLVIKNI